MDSESRDVETMRRLSPLPTKPEKVATPSEADPPSGTWEFAMLPAETLEPDKPMTLADGWEPVHLAEAASGMVVFVRRWNP